MANGVKERLSINIEGALRLNQIGQEITVEISDTDTRDLRELLSKVDNEKVKISVTYVNEIEDVI